MIFLYFDTVVTKVSVTYHENIMDARSACLLYRDTRLLKNNIIYKGRQPLMSVIYKEGVSVNGVANRISSLLFIVCSVAIQNAGKVAVATLSNLYRSKNYPYYRGPGECCRVKWGAEKGLRDNPAPKPNNVLYSNNVRCSSG